MSCCDEREIKSCCGGTRTTESHHDDVRDKVRRAYTDVVTNSAGCCGTAATNVETVGRRAGYSQEQLDALPEGANLGLGCGNPTAIGTLRPGEVVVDLGSGAGIDAFLAAEQVGPTGRVIGVDMTQPMLDKARSFADSEGYKNVEFRKGVIEDLPIDDASVDVIISNCVINLSPDKAKVFGEAMRVLRPGGRLMVSDIVLERPLPEAVRDSVSAYVGCIAGAEQRTTYLAIMEAAGFVDTEVVRETSYAEVFASDSSGSSPALDPLLLEISKELAAGPEEVRAFASGVTSISLLAHKPA